MPLECLSSKLKKSILAEPARDGEPWLFHKLADGLSKLLFLQFFNDQKWGDPSYFQKSTEVNS
jgi:hypothetical protein